VIKLKSPLTTPAAPPEPPPDPEEPPATSTKPISTQIQLENGEVWEADNFRKL